MEKLPWDLEECVSFHGHLCPGLVYGYLVAKEASRLLNTTRAIDEELVVVAENDSCAVDALQVILGATLGKGNLLLKNYGKNVFTIFTRGGKEALRFARKSSYLYEGAHAEEFNGLEQKYIQGIATEMDRRRQKHLKSLDLLAKGCSQVFNIEHRNAPDVPKAPLAPSVACARCGEMTMKTKMVDRRGVWYCVPCTDNI
ncbi:MAG: FmdE family protein [Smithellaceae bacterium]|nr:FmdE family protein [Smithellaceae bacterium]